MKLAWTIVAVALPLAVYPPQVARAADGKADAAKAGAADGGPISGVFHAEPVASSPRLTGSGLAWWDGRLVVADRVPKQFLSFTPPDKFEVLKTVTHPVGAAAGPDGSLVFTEKSPDALYRVARLDRDGREQTLAESKVDVKQAPDGVGSPHFVAVHPNGTIYWSGFPDGGTRYLLPGAKQVTIAKPRVVHTYGIGLSPEHDWLYVASKIPNPDRRGVWRFPVDRDGRLGEGELFIRVDQFTTTHLKDLPPAADGSASLLGWVGRLQGLAVDRLGYVYVGGAESHHSGSAVAAFSPDGKRLAAMVVGVPRNISGLAFGGADGRTLFITGAGEYPLFHARLPVAGEVFRGRAQATPAPPPAAPKTVPQAPAAPPSGRAEVPLVPARVGDAVGKAAEFAAAPAATLLRADGGRQVLTATGREPHPGKDVATFAGVETDAPNFTFTARIAGGQDDPPAGAKVGITVRAGLAGPEKAVHLRYDAHDDHRCLQWVMRYHVSPDTHDGSRRAVVSGIDRGFAKAPGTWLRVVRRYPYVDLLASDDGKSWRPAGDYRPVLLPQKVWVGLQLTAGGAVTSGRVLDYAYDNVSFTVDPTDAATERRDAYKEHTPPVGTWRMNLVTVGSGKAEASAFLLMPKDMGPRSIRAILYTAGSKEEAVNGKPLAFEKEAGRRRPVGMTTWEGSIDIEGIRPFNAMLAHHGIVRVGGYFPPELYDEAVRKLADASGIDFLPNVPFVVTGASFAGGMSAKAAQLYPDRCIASAPVIIGMAGSETTNPRVLAVPHLHVFGTRDGGHLGDVAKALPALRDRHALWGAAPMWMVYHRQHKADAIIYPFFLEAMRLRLPENPDYAAGPVALKPLREADGWLGLMDESWRPPAKPTAGAPPAARPAGPAVAAALEVSAPVVTPFSERHGERDAAWLPSERVARVWQAFVSNNPRTVIHFPMFEGRETYGGVSAHGWHNSSLAAGEPFELVASGPVGPGAAVEYFDAGEPIRVVKRHGDNPYRVTLAAREPGLRAIYAVTTVDGRREVSRPVTVFFHERR